MAYQANQGQSKSGNFQGKTSTNRPAANSSTGGKKRPVHNIAFKAPGEKELVRVTGVFANVDEATGALKSKSVKMKESVTIPAGSTLYIFDEKAE